MKHLKDDVGAIFKDINADELFSNRRDQKRAVTFWVRDDHKAKYDLIQLKSERKFGKQLAKIIERYIEAISIEEDEAS